jgi:hypothetical protein
MSSRFLGAALLGGALLIATVLTACDLDLGCGNPCGCGAPNRDVPSRSTFTDGGVTSEASLTIDGEPRSVGVGSRYGAGWCAILLGRLAERTTSKSDASTDADADADADGASDAAPDVAADPPWLASAALRWRCGKYSDEQGALESLAAQSVFCRDGLALELSDGALEAAGCVDSAGAREPAIVEPASGVVDYELTAYGSRLSASVPAHAERRVAMEVTITTESAHHDTTPSYVACY